jgi:hypothetical protein
MIFQFKPSALRQTRWHEYLVRFVLGGVMTVVAGVIAARFGPVIGGLFLAFPAIFPASATLIEKHVRERKEKAGLPGARRGKEAAALDAAGATLGSFGLVAFGLVIWLMMVRLPLGPSSSLRLRGSLSRCLHGRCGDGCRRLTARWAISYCLFP